MNIVRVWLVGLVALGMWFLCLWGSEPHKPPVVSPTGTAFSVDNAEHALARVLGPEKPHPVGTSENAAVRGRILKEFAALGVPARTYTAFTCNALDARKFGAMPCATVTDIIADIVPGDGNAIVMLAHYDSVPAGPGASDDQSGVATVLETVRALKAAHAKSLHPVMAVITDGEEAGLLGANAFLQNAALKARVGAVVNVEARGTRGASLLFQTSAGDSKLIDLYAHSVPFTSTSSLYAEIYKFLPNDTDLTLFLQAGFPAYNFAFSENVRYYHSPFDVQRNLGRATLQMHGDNLLGVTRSLQQTDFGALKGGNDVYMSVLGLWLPRMPSAWALPLSLVCLVVIAIAGWLTRKPDDGPIWRAALTPLALIAGCVVLGFILAFVAQLISGASDPTYAYPLPMRVALGLSVWAMTMLVARMTSSHGAAASAWLWMAGLAVVTAATLPGLSPYFLFPSIVAAVLLLAAAFVPGKWESPFGRIAIFVSAIAALLSWMPLVVNGETLMGLRLHPLFTVPAAFGLMTLVPLIASWPRRRLSWTSCETFAFIAVVAVTTLAGLHPAYSVASPQRLNLQYFEAGKAPAHWIAATAWKGSGTATVPPQLVGAGGFRFDTNAYGPLDLGSAYTAPAGSPRYPLPTATVVNDRASGTDRVVTLRFRGSPETSALFFHIPKDAHLAAVDMRGQHLSLPAKSDGLLVNCASPDCRDLTVTLTLHSHAAVTIAYAEARYTFPAFGAYLQQARPKTAMPSQSGDLITLANMLKLRSR